MSVKEYPHQTETSSANRQIFTAETFINMDDISEDERTFVKALGLVRVSRDKESYYEANTPDGRLLVKLTLINGLPAAAYYRVDSQTQQKTIMAAWVPGLRKEAITRGNVAENKASYLFPHEIPAEDNLC